MNLRLLHDGILIKREIVQEGKFELINAHKDKPYQGIVVMTGPGIDEPVDCSPGDTILFNHNKSLIINLEGQEYYYIREVSVVLVKEKQSVNEAQV